MGAENCPTRRQRNAGTRPKDWYMEGKKKIKETKEEEIKEIKQREDPESLIENVVGSAPANGGDVRQENDWQAAQICCFPLFHRLFFIIE